MRTQLLAAAGLAAAGLLLAGCGSSAPAGQAAPATSAPASAEPANPVPLLRQAGATPAPGTATGEHGAYGDRYAAGTIGSEDVRAYTAADAAAYRANLAGAWTPDDTQAVITIPARNAVVILTGYIDPAKGSGPQWAPGGTAAQVAARVGGTVVQP